MLKVLVIDRYEYCDGEAYIYAGEYKDKEVERPIYLVCQACTGSGELEKPISLREFADLLDHAIAMAWQIKNSPTVGPIIWQTKTSPTVGLNRMSKVKAWFIFTS